jgi:hypothetical protein
MVSLQVSRASQRSAKDSRFALVRLAALVGLGDFVASPLDDARGDPELVEGSWGAPPLGGAFCQAV